MAKKKKPLRLHHSILHIKYEGEMKPEMVKLLNRMAKIAYTKKF